MRRLGHVKWSELFLRVKVVKSGSIKSCFLISCIRELFETSRIIRLNIIVTCRGISPERLFFETSKIRSEIISAEWVGISPDNLLLLKSTVNNFKNSHNCAGIRPSKLHPLMLRKRSDIFAGSRTFNKSETLILKCLLLARLRSSSDLDVNWKPDWNDAKLFPSKWAVWSPAISPTCFGICPEKLLLAKCRCHRFFISPIDEGIFPEKWFPTNRHSINPGKYVPKFSGSVPFNPEYESCMKRKDDKLNKFWKPPFRYRVSFKSRNQSFFNFTILFGIEPFNLFPSRERICKSVKFPMSCGISPVSPSPIWELSWITTKDFILTNVSLGIRPDNLL